MEIMECDRGCECSRCNPEKAWQRHLRVLEPWYKKYESGELAGIPQDIMHRALSPRSKELATLYDPMNHPAIEAFLMYKYRNFSFWDMLNLGVNEKKV